MVRLRFRRSTIGLAACLLLAVAGFGMPAVAQQAAGTIYIVEVHGPVTSATIGYLQRSLTLAEAANANVLIISLSNSGGVLPALRPFATAVAQARVPVVAYVTSGTQSGVAGTLLLSAAHISVMAPDSSFGIPAPITTVDAALSEQTRQLVLDSVADQLRDWNAERGRGAGWVDQAVREGVVIDNQQASAAVPPIVDLVAADQVQLLTLLDGRIIELANGRSIQLATLRRTPTLVEPVLWESLQMSLATPTLVFALLVLGALAIYAELALPGTTIFAGIAVMLLAGAVIGLLALPVQGWALLLLLVALALIGAEFFVPTHGALAVIGIVLLIVGGMNLFDPLLAPGATIAGWVVPVAALVASVCAGTSIWIALSNRARPIATGIEVLIGRTGVAMSDLAPRGTVRVNGEVWSATADDQSIKAGAEVQIVDVEGVTLWVRLL